MEPDVPVQKNSSKTILIFAALVLVLLIGGAWYLKTNNFNDRASSIEQNDPSRLEIFEAEGTVTSVGEDRFSLALGRENESTRERIVTVHAFVQYLKRSQDGTISPSENGFAEVKVGSRVIVYSTQNLFSNVDPYDPEDKISAMKIHILEN